MLMMFLVGGGGGGHTFTETKQISQRVCKDLFDSDFVENTKMSQWDPIQEGEHLGFIVNLKDGSFWSHPPELKSLSHF